MLGRQQYVRIGAEASSLSAICRGVPQDLILGSALFTTYFKQILRCWEGPNISKFGSRNHTLTIQNSIGHFLSKILAVWSRKLMIIYGRLRLGVAVV